MDGVVPMKVREVIQLLEKYGWKQIRTKGSHRHFKHPEERRSYPYRATKGKSLRRAR